MTNNIKLTLQPGTADHISITAEIPIESLDGGTSRIADLSAEILGTSPGPAEIQLFKDRVVDWFRDNFSCHLVFDDQKLHYVKRERIVFDVSNNVLKVESDLFLKNFSPGKHEVYVSVERIQIKKSGETVISKAEKKLKSNFFEQTRNEILNEFELAKKEIGKEVKSINESFMDIEKNRIELHTKIIDNEINLGKLNGKFDSLRSSITEIDTKIDTKIDAKFNQKLPEFQEILKNKNLQHNGFGQIVPNIPDPESIPDPE